MMIVRHLAILRHAKAEPIDTAEDDFARELTARGRRVATGLGDFLAVERTDFVPEGIVTSPAARAFATAELVGAALGFPADRLTLDERLYEATPSDILEVVHELPDEWAFVVLVGHNPGLSEFANQLVDRASVGDLPTGGLAWLTSDAGSWREVAPAAARLHQLWSPRDLELA